MMNFDAPLFVHSDMGRGIIAAKQTGARIDPRAVQRSLIDFLANLVTGGTDSLVFPAFNYDYGSKRIFNVDSDAVQVGALPEWLRHQSGTYRSKVPFFSVLSGHDLGLKNEGHINPFGDASAFQWLVDHNATLILLGAPLQSLTFVHHVEEMSGGPAYRYEKPFPGQIVSGSETVLCEFSMHVRPMGVHMEYDWTRLETDLRSQGILKHSPDAPALQWLNARALLEYWGNKISSKPFYLLDGPSQDFFKKATDDGKNRGQQGDYEKV